MPFVRYPSNPPGVGDPGTIEMRSNLWLVSIVIGLVGVVTAALVARSVGCSVVNAGDGQHEHPSQALLDAYTLWRRWGTLAGKRVAIVGDSLHSRVARSNLLCLKALLRQLGELGLNLFQRIGDAGQVLG